MTIARVVLSALLFCVLAAQADHHEATVPAYTEMPTAEPVNAEQAAAWRADLAYLAEQLVARHGDAFNQVSQSEFEAEVSELHAAIPSLARHEIIVGMARLVAMVGDGHTVLPMLFDPAAGLHQLPIRLGWYSDGLWIDAAAAEHRALVGQRVVAIGEHTIERAIEQVTPLISRDNDEWIKVIAPLMLTRGEILHAVGLSDTPVAATLGVVSAEGERNSVSLAIEDTPVRMRPYMGPERLVPEDWVKASAGRKPALSFARPGVAYWWQRLPEHDAIYVQYNQVNNDQGLPTVHQMFREVMQAVEAESVDKLILDIRWNPGGEGFLNTAVVRGLIGSRVNHPGKLFVLIGPNTFSAAQLLSWDLKRWTDAIFIGAPTGSGTHFWGDHKMFRLPHSRLRASASPTWWQPAGPYNKRPYLAPDVGAEFGFADYANQRDPALEVALNWEDRVTVDSLFASFRQHGDRARLAAEVRAWAADPAQQFARVPDQINRYAYLMARDTGWANALETFQLNVEIHPDYANGWDSLGEVLAQLGRHEESLAAYKKAYALDPHVGKAAEVLKAHGVIE